MNNNSNFINSFGNGNGNGHGHGHGNGHGNGYNNGNDGGKPRFKSIKKYNKNNDLSQEDTDKKFDVVKSHGADLLDKDDIKVSKEVIEDEKDNFDDMCNEEGLKENLLRGIYAYGFEKPSRIQSLAIPQIINGREILAQSQSGTGKTGAFLISAIQLVDESIRAPQVIILSPTHVLAQQTYMVGKSIVSFFDNLTFSFTVGGTDRNQNLKELGFKVKEDDKVAQIIVATPGRLLDLLDSHSFLFDHIKLFIVDECDELLAGTFKDELKNIIERLPTTIQISLFSATLTNEVVSLADILLKNPVKILIKKEKMTLDGIIQTYVDIIREEQKLDVLMDMLATLQIQQFIVYVNSKKRAEWLKQELEKENYAVMTINGGQNKLEIAEIVRKFKQGNAKCLISTDLLCRGIDIQQLSLVINYDMPKADNIQTYIHRIGRTGRYGKKGLTINLVTKYEKDVQNLISLTFKCPIKPLESDFIKLI
jgi:translation initiation factor 4A